MEVKSINTDVLIIGGGASGCFCGIKLSELTNSQILVVDKGHIKRSGCLAAGVNALNAYIGKNESPESFLEYVKKDSASIIRDDLVYSVAKKLNAVTEQVEKMGLVIKKENNGEYEMRSKRSVKINGENIKPLLANELTKQKNVRIINKLIIVDYLISDGKVIGAYGFTLDDETIYSINSKITVCATGGASGLYKPNNPGYSKHKMWYSPFNTGAGYAMGIRAGAEMTTFEMRFIALRCKDTIAPTGTIAQGIDAIQINKINQAYMNGKKRQTTSDRLHETVKEYENGQGPCSLKTKGISENQTEELYKAYLNMAPSQTLKWIESSTPPHEYNVEICGTEPYIVGGHTGSGYWVDTNRKTTLQGLYAIGDVSGGNPKKYVTGCFAEAEIAAESISTQVNETSIEYTDEQVMEELSDNLKSRIDMCKKDSENQLMKLESDMQTVMDIFAGGISCGYAYSEAKLRIAQKRISRLIETINDLKISNLHELLFLFEVKDRLYVSKILIHHMLERQETRWRSYQENLDYPEQSLNWEKFVNSVFINGEVRMIHRSLVSKDKHYEHQN